MKEIGSTTFACLVERAARHPIIVRRNQMRKVAYTCTRDPASRTLHEAKITCELPRRGVAYQARTEREDLAERQSYETRHQTIHQQVMR